MDTLRYFNPPAPCGAGPQIQAAYEPINQFQSTRPVRGGTHDKRAYTQIVNFNPPAPCGAGHFPVFNYHNSRLISIHPPRAGRDQGRQQKRGADHDFNPPAPCGAGLCCAKIQRKKKYFNPPAPCGAGRGSFLYLVSNSLYFNPPAPCGAGRYLYV